MIRIRRLQLALALMAIVFSIVHQAFEQLEFDSEELQDRYRSLTLELRCPKCLNINIAESDAPIAADLRKTVHRLLHEGKTDDEVRAFLVARYGDFILYDPPLNPATLALWVLPVVLVLLGVWVVLQLGARRAEAQLTDEERRRLDELKDT